MIYFDNAATTYPKPQCVYDSIDYAMKNYAFNAGRGSYTKALDTFKMIEKTRELIGSIINVTGDKVIFTSSATESLNNILYGLDLHSGDAVFISPFEHNAVVRTLYNIGVEIVIIPFDKKTWNIDENLLKDLYVLKKPKATVISHVSNVTGFEIPYERIFEIGKLYNSINVLDCAQSFGIYPISSKNVDFLVFAGHKSLYAMFGIAGYINLSLINLSVFKVGGTGSDSLNLEMPSELPSRYEAGSYNSVGIFSIFNSINFLKEKRFDLLEEDLTKYLILNLTKIDKIKLFLPENYCSKGIVSFAIDGYTSDDVGIILNQDYDICVRTGYHCAPYIHDFIESKKYGGTVRVSLGIFSTKSEIDVLINALKEL